MGKPLPTLLPSSAHFLGMHMQLPGQPHPAAICFLASSSAVVVRSHADHTAAFLLAARREVVIRLQPSWELRDRELGRAVPPAALRFAAGPTKSNVVSCSRLKGMREGKKKTGTCLVIIDRGATQRLELLFLFVLR